MSPCCSVYLCAKYDSILYVDYYKALNINNIDKIKKQHNNFLCLKIERFGILIDESVFENRIGFCGIVNSNN